MVDFTFTQYWQVFQRIIFSMCRLNGDQFTPLDVALMLNEYEIANILLRYGATENSICKFMFTLKSNSGGVSFC